MKTFKPDQVKEYKNAQIVTYNQMLREDGVYAIEHKDHNNFYSGYYLIVIDGLVLFYDNKNQKLEKAEVVWKTEKDALIYKTNKDIIFDLL